MITEIFVEGYKLDLDADISSLLTFAIDDIRDFSSRSTTFSKTVVIPGTSNNNSIFGNIFDTGVQNDYSSDYDNIGFNFNPSVSASCLIFQDNLQTFKGTMRLMEIDIDRGRKEYQVALNGELTNLSVSLSGGFLTDLDFSAYNVVYNTDNISASWDNAPGSGVYFPSIDYGNYSVDKKNWDFRTFRPALYVKEYIDKMFAAAGFTYTCDLFQTDRFKKLIVPHNQKQLLSLSSLVIQATTSHTTTVIDTNSFLPSSILKWDTLLAGAFTYSGGTFTYTSATPLSTTLFCRFVGKANSTSLGSTFKISIRKNGVAIATYTSPLITAANTNYSWFPSMSFSMVTGDTIDVFYQYATGVNITVTSISGNSLGLNSGAPVLLPIAYGQLITINDSLPQNIRQVDFLLSIVKLFNLYIYESKFDDRSIIISPFIDFYSGVTADVVDWTYKMDRNSVIKIKPMSEINSKTYKFTYASDTDFYNDLYNKRYNQLYGSLIFDTGFEFTSDQNTVELIFAPTPIVGYDGEAKIYPTIFKRTGNAPPYVEENIDSVIRIMQSKKTMGVPAWSIMNGATVVGSYTSYGYAGHLDDPDAPSTDLNFGALNELFFVLASGDLSKTQFNVYWSAYMAEITDKDSKLITAEFYLTPKDIFNLDFSHYVYLDGNLWRLNKITDYNASIPATCSVELLKVINTTYKYVTFPPILDTFRIMWSPGNFILSSGTDKIRYQ